eukprot:3241473-Ditylum_brightwellii.AAC.1
MDDGAFSMYRKNTGYGLFSISSRQAYKRKSGISMMLSDVSNALDDRLLMDALEETRYMASTMTVKSN